MGRNGMICTTCTSLHQLGFQSGAARSCTSAPLPFPPKGGKGVGGANGGARLLTDLADRVQHLYPSHRDPERFHLDKLAIERDLRRLARKVQSYE